MREHWAILAWTAAVGVGLLCSSGARAECAGQSPSWTSSPDQESVESCIASAADGDTIAVSEGAATWTGRIAIADKGVVLLGAGAGRTVITSGGFTLTSSASRISGFTFEWSSNEYTWVIEGSLGFRIDHNAIVYPSASDMLLSYGQSGHPVEGLVDNNDITYGRILYYGDNNGETAGNNRWAEPLDLGTEHFLFIEDNTISWPDGSSGGYLNHLDGNWGCRYVERFNTILNGRTEAHSLQGDDERGCRAWEIYENTLTNNGDPSFRQWFIRGGTGVIFHESSDGAATNRSISIDNARSFEVSIESQLPTFGMCDGSSFIDQNVAGGQGYRCRDQIGASTDASEWASDYEAPAPEQAFQPAYIFRNTDPSGEIPVTINCDDSGIPCDIQSTRHIVEGRDYYTYREGFDGTAGVGEGTLAERPATCTPGVGYWVTDEGEWNSRNPGADGRLYVCSAANTWSLYYTPYAYPHPLQGAVGPGGPSVDGGTSADAGAAGGGDDAGCGCRASSTSTPSRPWIAVVVLGAIGVAVRRRRSR